MPTFETPDSPVTVPLKAQIVKGQTLHVGQAAFTVTNKSGQTVTAHLTVVPQGNAKAEWLQIQGEPERDFAGNQTQKVVVNITAPTGTPPGDYKFYECVSNNNDRDNDFTNSAVVTFNVPPPEVVKPGVPWWVWVIAGVVVLAIIVVLAIVLWPSGKVSVPNVSTGQIAYADAAKQITDAQLKPVEADVESTTVAAGNVISQDPTAGTEVAKDSNVTLTVAKAAAPPPPPPPAQKFPVPDVASQGFSVDHAQGVLDASGFTSTTQNVAPQGKTPGTVVGQNPAAGAEVTADQKSVMLNVDPGVAVPDISSTKNFSFQAAYNRLHAVGLEIGGQSCAQDAAHVGMIVAQGTATGTMVAKGQGIAVTIGQQLCIHFIPRPILLNQGVLHVMPHH